MKQFMIDACVVKNSKSKLTVAKNLLEAFDTEDEKESSDPSKKSSDSSSEFTDLSECNDSCSKYNEPSISYENSGAIKRTC